MNLTNEQIKVILDGAPEGAIYYQVRSYVDENGLVWRDGGWVDFGWDGAGTPLSTLRHILEKEKENEELRQEVERLKSEQSELAAQAVEEFSRKMVEFGECQSYTDETETDQYFECGDVLDYAEKYANQLREQCNE